MQKSELYVGRIGEVDWIIFCNAIILASKLQGKDIGCAEA